MSLISISQLNNANFPSEFKANIENCVSKFHFIAIKV